MKNRVLILRLSSLGDIVQASGALYAFERADWDIAFVVKPQFAGLIRACAPKIQVYEYDSRAGELQARTRFFTWLEAEKFSCIVDLHDSLRTKFWRKKLRQFAPVFVAHKPRWQEFLVYILRLRGRGLGAGGRARLMQATALRALQNFPVKTPAQLTPELKPLAPLPLPLTYFQAPSADSPGIAGLPDSEYVVIVPGSAWDGKRWPETKFQELARELARFAPVVVLGSAVEDFCERIAIAARENAPASISLHGKTDLGECAAILARAHAIVGNDTGLVHLAESLGKDVVAIEGPTHPALGYSVYRPGSKIIAEDLVCRPCSKNGEPCLRWGSRLCLEAIPVAEVLREVLKRGKFGAAGNI